MIWVSHFSVGQSAWKPDWNRDLQPEDRWILQSAHYVALWDEIKYTNSLHQAGKDISWSWFIGDMNSVPTENKFSSLLTIRSYIAT